MPAFMVDTICKIAMVQDEHTHHVRAYREFNARIDRGERLVVAVHALVETYSVLTRLPLPLRLPPFVAQEVLATTFESQGELVALAADAYVRLLQRAADRNILGGRVYDALIVACAVEAGVDALLTFNECHFIDLAPPSL